MNITQRFTTAVAFVAAMAGCASQTQFEGGRTGAAAGSLAANIAAEALNLDRGTSRSLERLARTIGTTTGRTATANNVFCRETSNNSRRASQNNLTGEITSDRTSQSVSQRCRSGIFPAGTTNVQAIDLIFKR